MIIERGPEKIVIDVLRRAISETLKKAPPVETLPAEPNADARSWVQNLWIDALRNAFEIHYPKNPENEGFAGFGGTKHGTAGHPCGIKEWRRWEFLYDVAVLARTTINAAYAEDSGEKRKLAIIERAIWLVESEMSLDGKAIAVDASKLRIARTENTLFIAAQTTKSDPEKWLEFLNNALSGCSGNVFLALIPSYASKNPLFKHWEDSSGEAIIYRCGPSGCFPNELTKLSFENL